MTKAILTICGLCLWACLANAAGKLNDTTIQSWIADMKEAPRGPFAHIRWFCKDGQILEPEPFACEEFGGGVQHGEWSKQTKAIREAGYPIANVLADIKPRDIVPRRGSDDAFRFLLLEKFLVAYDNGWILRKALFYRGAFQTHNEWDSAQSILQTLVLRDEWLNDRYALLFEAARLLPHGAESQSLLTKIRGTSSLIASKQAAFSEIRNKIHIAPDRGDAKRVREFAADKGEEPLLEQYEELATNIEKAYGDSDVLRRLNLLLRQLGDKAPAGRLRQLKTAIESTDSAEEQVEHLGALIQTLRTRLPDIPGSKRRVLALDTAVAASVALFARGAELRQVLPSASRDTQLGWIVAQSRGLYGMGLISKRELAQISRSITSLRQPGAEGTPTVRLSDYRRELELLGRVPNWASRRLEGMMGDTIEKFSRIEPLAIMYVADRLRSSPMLFYALAHESLSQDADNLAGVEHQLLGNPAAGTLRALNPGLARGVLRHASELGRAHTDPANEIYLVPETTPDLPAVAGIITESEGNALSHVQLLARNLGVPNVVVGNQSLPLLRAQLGKTIVLAASPGGVVQILADGGQGGRINTSFIGQENKPTPIRVDLEKLDLQSRSLLPTTRLTARDSGRSVGPKAAHVGELSHRFPGTVSPGLVIPFGIYRDALQAPAYPNGPTMFDWIKDQLQQLSVNRVTDPAGHQDRLADFLGRVRGWFNTFEFNDGFRDLLQQEMEAVFGPIGSFGVFVRSDTNIEDLDGFTGAGLNKTVPHVIDFEEVLEGIKKVWASPFSERAYSWRQGQMDQPEHVYVSVLLHRSVGVDKSGVMVTADVDTGSTDWITVVASPGVGGGVDGQAAEEVRINLKDTGFRLMATATQKQQRVLNPQGGVTLVPAPSKNRLLTQKQLDQLADFSRQLPERYPGILDEDGNAKIADIEYGFEGDKLWLFQIRPFVQNNWAGQSDYLAELDASLKANANRIVNLTEPPLR